MNYTVIRSKRKTLALQIKQGALIVRAPYAVRETDIDRFVANHRAWIEKHLALETRRREASHILPPLSPEELRHLTEEARCVIPPRVEQFAAELGVSYGRISIRHQTSRWGSCSSQGNLNFNCLLLLAPPEILDYIIVHELCHRKEMNHSPRFYALLDFVMPDHRTRATWLKEHGRELMSRLPERSKP